MNEYAQLASIGRIVCDEYARAQFMSFSVVCLAIVDFCCLGVVSCFFFRSFK